MSESEMAILVRSGQTPPMQNHLKDWRDSRGWTMEEMGKRLGNATASQVNKLEKGHQKLTAEWLARYGKAFGVDPKDILGPPKPIAGPQQPPANFDADAFVASIKVGLELSGVKLSRAEEMKLVGHALEIYERILAGADPAQLLADLVKADDAGTPRLPARR